MFHRGNMGSYSTDTCYAAISLSDCTSAFRQYDRHWQFLDQILFALCRRHHHHQAEHLFQSLLHRAFSRES